VRVQSARALSDLALLTLTLAAALAVVANATPVRPFVVFAAAVLVPGGALLTKLRTEESITDLALAMGLSLAIDIAGSLILAWSGWWHPVALAIALGAASSALLLADLLEVGRAP
jgi:CHASE2 domain-containing sensor protein